MDADNFCFSFLKSESTAGGADNKPVFSLLKNWNEGLIAGEVSSLFLSSPLLSGAPAAARTWAACGSSRAGFARRAGLHCAHGEGMRLSRALIVRNCQRWASPLTATWSAKHSPPLPPHPSFLFSLPPLLCLLLVLGGWGVGGQNQGAACHTGSVPCPVYCDTILAVTRSELGAGFTYFTGVRPGGERLSFIFMPICKRESFLYFFYTAGL